MNNNEEFTNNQTSQSTSSQSGVNSFPLNNNQKNREEATEIGNKIANKKRTNMQESTSRSNTIDESESVRNGSGLGDKPENKIDSGDKENVKEALSKKDIAKNIGSGLGNAALNSAENSDNDLVRGAAKTVNAGRKAVKTVKTIKNLKNGGTAVKAAGKVISAILPYLPYVLLGLAIFALLMIVGSLIFNVIGMKYGTTGEETYETFNEMYQEGMTNEELEAIYNNHPNSLCDSSFLDKTKYFFGIYDLGNICDFSHFINKQLKNKEKPNSEDQIGIDNLSPGYFLSTLFYAYDTQPVDKDGDLVLESNTDNLEDEEISQKLNDIDLVTRLFVKNKISDKPIYKRDDIKKLLDQTIIDIKYKYLVEEPFFDSITGEQIGTECVTKSMHEYVTSNDKFKLYLRYGEEVTKAYEDDLALYRTYTMTSEECMSELPDSLDSKPNLKKYEVYYKLSDNEQNNLIDLPKLSIKGKTYDYSSGFIYDTYPKFDPVYTLDNFVIPLDMDTVKEIENIISDIELRQDYFNYILGYNSNILNQLNKQSVSKICKYNIGGKEISNIYIRLLHGENPIAGQELVPLEDYIMGVIYSGNDGLSLEAMKSKAVVLRNQILNKEIKNEDGNNIIEIVNSSVVNGVNNNLTYCDIVNGCSIVESGGVKSYYTVGTEPTSVTINSSKPALGEDSGIEEAVSSVAGVTLLDDSKNIVNLVIDVNAENKFNADAASKDYVEILTSYYGGLYDVSESVCAIGDWIWPTASKYSITSCFGLRSAPTAGASTNHNGLDIAGGDVVLGSPIFAASDGEIVYLGNSSSAGIYVTIKHDDTFTSRYLHMSRHELGLQVGDTVQAGQIIGYVGNTGISTGPHLHFDIKQNGVYINPLQIFGEEYNPNNKCAL